MSTTTIRARFKPGGVLADADAVVLSDAAATFGVKRRDTGALVVAANTAMVRQSLGVYAYTFTDPAPELEYEFYVAFTYGSQTIYEQRTIRGGTAGNLYDVIPLVASHVGGVPTPFLKQILRQIGRDFCHQTEVWREMLDAIDSVKDQADYTLVHSYDADILRVRDVTYNTLCWAYTVDAAGEVITLDPTPNRDDLEIVAKVVFWPHESCSVYPSWLISRWGRAIAEGTKARLASMQGRPWFNATQAQLSDAEYRRLMGEAKMENQTRKGGAQLRIRPGRFI